MTKQTHAAPPPLMIPLDRLVESPLNPRTHFDPARLKELATSLKGPAGCIEPVVVRPGKKPEFWEIIAGARRNRAAKIAGLKELPAVVKILTDVQVLEAMVIENDQREDPHPMEQGEGYSKLLKQEGYTVEILAEKIGKEAGYIYRRIKLADLIEPVKKAFWKNEIPYTHATLISRELPGAQHQIWNEGVFHTSAEMKDGKRVEIKQVVSRDQLQAWILRNIHLNLAQAPFDLGSETLLPKAGSCILCTKRSGANLQLFDDQPSKEDRCQDRKCYAAKVQAFVQISLIAAKEDGKKLVPIGVGHFMDGDRGKLPPGTLTNNDGYRILQHGEKKCAAAEPAMVAGVARHYQGVIGEKVLICRDSKCPTHRSIMRSGRVDRRSPADIWRQKEAALARDIETDAQVVMREKIVEAAKGSFEMFHARCLAAHLVGDGSVEQEALAKELGVECKAKKGMRDSSITVKIEEAIFKVKDADIPKLLLRILLEVDNYTFSGRKSSLDRCIERYKIDRKKIVAEVRKEKRKAFAAEKAAALKPKKATGPGLKKHAARGSKKISPAEAVAKVKRPVGRPRKEASK